jgi:protein SCO1
MHDGPGFRCAQPGLRRLVGARRQSPAPRLAAVVCAALLAAALAGCDSGGPKFKASDVTGTTFGRELALTGHDGRPRTLADFRGKVVVLFFGYTQCPDVCPTTLSELAEAMQRLGPDAERVQVLFATVDPERDTPELLSRYVPAFNPAFLGLYGDAEATARAAKEFKIIYQKQPGREPGTYTMDHSAGTFLFDPQGRLRVYVSYGQGPDVFVHDIRELLRSATR